MQLNYSIVLQVLTCVTLAWSAQFPNDRYPANDFKRIGNKDYYISERPADWYKARDDCYSRGADLVSFETNAEYDEVKRYLKDNSHNHRHFWTSGNDLDRKGIHRWHANGKTINLNRWASLQPDNFLGDEHCIEMGLIYLFSYNLELNDRNCGTEFLYVCEVSDPTYHYELRPLIPNINYRG